MDLDKLQAEVEEAERAARARRGFPPDHLTDFAHFPFAFAAQDLKRFRAAAGDDPRYARQIAIADEDFTRATQLTEGPPATFAAVQGEYPKEPAFFFSCDGIYFKSLCLPLLMSIAEHSPGIRCHVHVIDTPPELRAIAEKIPLRLSFTSEESGIPVAEKQTRWKYYNAVRFIRFAEALAQNPGPLWIADVDALVTKDIVPLLKSTASLAMRMRAGRLDADKQASACLVMGTRRSLPFFQTVAHIIRTQPFYWGVDQFALFAAFVALKPDVELLGPDMAAVSAEEPGTFWFTAGQKKLTLLQDQTGYAREFRRHAQRFISLQATRSP